MLIEFGGPDCSAPNREHRQDRWRETGTANQRRRPDLTGTMATGTIATMSPAPNARTARQRPSHRQEVTWASSRASSAGSRAPSATRSRGSSAEPYIPTRSPSPFNRRPPVTSSTRAMPRSRRTSSPSDSVRPTTRRSAPTCGGSSRPSRRSCPTTLTSRVGRRSEPWPLRSKSPMCFTPASSASTRRSTQMSAAVRASRAQEWDPCHSLPPIRSRSSRGRTPLPATPPRAHSRRRQGRRWAPRRMASPRFRPIRPELSP